MELYDSTTGASVQGGPMDPSQLMSIAVWFRKISPQFGWPALVLLTLAPHSTGGLGWTEYSGVFLALGLPVLLCGLALRLWARGYNRKEGFVIDGPYRYIRNPVEVGALLTYVGAGLVLGLPWWFTLALGLITIFFLSIVGLQVDRDLSLFFGRPFLRYSRRVKRWIPTRLPGTNRTDRNFSLSQAFLHEKESLLWICGFLVVFALRSRFVVWMDPWQELEVLTRYLF
jgi:protein-S-isoprenylcysteine O-methyltransferase Ste14